MEAGDSAPAAAEVAAAVATDALAEDDDSCAGVRSRRAVSEPPPSLPPPPGAAAVACLASESFDDCAVDGSAVRTGGITSAGAPAALPSPRLRLLLSTSSPAIGANGDAGRLRILYSNRDTVAISC